MKQSEDIMQPIKNILFSMSLENPCPCIQDITIPDQFLIKELAEINYRNNDNYKKSSCLKNVFSKYLIRENYYNIWIAEDFLDSHIVFSNQLEKSVTIRNLCELKYQHNLGDAYYCGEYLKILLLEARNYFNTASETLTENSLISFYSKEYELFKTFSLFSYYGSTLFTKNINPILAFNLRVKKTLCESVSRNILFIPYINKHVLSQIKFDLTIINQE